MKAIELVKTSSCKGTIFEMKVFIELDNENMIKWHGGNSLNKSATYCVKKNNNGMALFMMAINPFQKWHFVGKIEEFINEKNHPSRHDIIGKSKEELLNRRPYIVAAIEAWTENKYDATPDRVAYNINYFEVELQIIDKELKTK